MKIRGRNDEIELLGVNKDINSYLEYFNIENATDYNLPSGYTEGIGITVKRSEPGVRLQIALLNGSGSRNVFFRHSWASAPNWTEWEQL